MAVLMVGVMSIIHCQLSTANDTIYVSGGIQHDGLFPTRDMSAVRTTPRAKWAKIDHLSNNYLDLSVNYLRTDSNAAQFRGVRADVRIELNQWPLLGYEPGFAGHGLGRLSLTTDFAWGQISVGDVYGQFGSGLVLDLYENRDLGIDNSLRGAKISAAPYKGIQLTLIGGKQRRYWNCYEDGAWGWNYRKDAVLGADMELGLHEWSQALQQNDLELTIGGSYVSKYEQDDTILVALSDGLYRYNLPRWVGAGDVRANLQGHGWDALIEYAYKANDPTLENGYSYRSGQTLLMSLGYSRKGLSVLAQAKRSDNMSLRSSRSENGLAGRLNLLPVFTPQHTYALAARYPYATQYTIGEWAFQAEVCYTAPRKSKVGGKYGTTFKLSAAHVRGLREEGSWAVNTTADGTYYTDIHATLHKKVNPYWTINAMLMYQTYNRKVIEGEGGLVRAGVVVLDNKVEITDNVTLRNEMQYLYTKQHKGQWVYLSAELDLWQHWTVSGSWEYNIGYALDATKEHNYTAMLTYSRDAHRVSAGYVKTSSGFNCSGGVCRYEPEQEGVRMSYSFTW